MAQIVPVILCGGSGSRLWPYSRTDVPKQFLKLVGNFTLLQNTARRTIEILGPQADNIVVVTLSSLAEETKNQLKEISPSINLHILHEPCARNTAAAVALALLYVKEKFGPDSYIWILPADHFIGDNDVIRQAVSSAVDVARDDYMVTFGIQPTRAETGYGYIRKAAPINDSEMYNVDEFVEKPSAKIAQGYVDSGHYLWSSGMHLFKTDAGLKNFGDHGAKILFDVFSAVATGSYSYPDAQAYEQICKQPFETAVMERTNKIAVIACDPQWSDVGSWESIWEIKDKDENGNAFEGSVFAEDTQNSMVIAKNRMVACVGVKDLIVIEMQDTVLIADKKSGSSLKALVENLRSNKRKELLANSSHEYSWGNTITLINNNHMTIRQIKLKPQATVWAKVDAINSKFFVIEGNGEIRFNGQRQQMDGASHFDLAPFAVYSISNKNNSDLIVCEVIDKSVAKDVSNDLGYEMAIENAHEITQNIGTGN